jgi:hypothetical protein
MWSDSFKLDMVAANGHIAVGDLISPTVYQTHQFESEISRAAFIYF